MRARRGLMPVLATKWAGSLEECCGSSLDAGHHTTLSLNFERFDPGTALKATGLESGSYGYVGAVFRY